LVKAKHSAKVVIVANYKVPVSVNSTSDIKENGICASTQGVVAAFHSYAITTLATFLHVVTSWHWIEWC